MHNTKVNFPFFFSFFLFNLSFATAVVAVAVALSINQTIFKKKKKKGMMESAQCITCFPYNHICHDSDTVWFKQEQKKSRDLGTTATTATTKTTVPKITTTQLPYHQQNVLN